MAKWRTKDLPFAGVYRLDVFNPLEVSGAFYSLMGWKLQKGVLRLTEGEEKALSTQTYEAAQPVQWMAHHIGTYYYVTNKELRKVATSESQITAAFTSSTPAYRLPSTFFRDRFLIGSVSEGLRWLNPSTDAWRVAGITPPASVPSAAAGDAGVLSGRYRYTITFVDDQGHESNPYMTNGLANYAQVTVKEKKINLTSIPTGGTGVTKRRIYRTIANGESYLYLTEIGDNTTTTLTGDNAADSTLGNALQYDNHVPPSNIRQIFSTSNRVYLVDGDDGKTLWASKIDPFTALPNWQAYPPDLSLQLPFGTTQDLFQAVFERNKVIYAASKLKIFEIVGDVGTGVQVNKALDEGFFGRFSWALLPNGIAYVNNEKRLKIWDGINAPTDIGANVQALLSQMLEDSGLDETTVIFDADEGAIQVFFKTSSGYASIRVDAEGKAWDCPSTYQNVIYAAGKIIGARPNSVVLYGEEGYKKDGSRRTVQTVEWQSIVPSPGSEVQFGRLKIEAKALPIISYVPPMLKVEVAYNDSPIFEEKMIDLSRDSLVQSAGTVPVKKVCYVPLHRRAESLQIKISSVNNNASLNNGIEIYAVSVEVEDEQSVQEGRNWPLDRKE